MTERHFPLPNPGMEAYDASYYFDADGCLQNTFAFNEDLTVARAKAIAEDAHVPSGGRILDYGCGPGALTAGFHELGYEVVGVDPSPHAVEHALPEAQGLVEHLNWEALSRYEKGTFDLVVAKDVFEHIDEDQLHDVADRLLYLGQQIMAIIPVVGEDGKFLFPLYDEDPTHVTRLTREEWHGFFPYTIAEDRHKLTPQVRREDKVDSTLCLRLAEPDPTLRQFIDSSMAPYEQTKPRTRLGRVLGLAAA